MAAALRSVERDPRGAREPRDQFPARQTRRYLRHGVAPSVVHAGVDRHSGFTRGGAAVGFR